MNEEPNKRYLFMIELQGTGKTQEEAWDMALECFAQDPGDPHTAVLDATLDENDEDIADNKPVKISVNPVYYVHIKEADLYDTLSTMLGYRGLADGDGQLLISTDEVRQQMVSLTEDEEADYEMGDDTSQAIEVLKEIVEMIDKDVFDGDVWIYTR